MRREGSSKGTSIMKQEYPSIYGKETSALPDILGPLNIDMEGDNLVPSNDMAEVGSEWAKGKASRDPLGVVWDSK